MDRALASLPVSSARRPWHARLSVTTVAVAAVVAGAWAIALLTWALLASIQADDAVEQATPAPGVRQAIAILSTPGTEQVPLAGSSGRVVLAVGPAGGGVLLLDGLGAAPEGSSFQAWVFGEDREAAVPAAVFTGTEPAVPLRVRVPSGASVAVTVEREGGVETLAREPRLVARRSS